MGRDKPSVKKTLGEYLSQRAPGPVTESEWQAIRERFDTTSEGYLRRLLRESGQALTPLVEGIRQSNYTELERTLVNLQEEYEKALEAKDRQRTGECRRLVIESKSHARLAGRRTRDPEQAALKEEMIRWMLVWLEDPGAFPLWVRLRKRQMSSS